MKCEDCKHWLDNGSNLSSCDRDALLRERDFFCAAWERKKPFERPDTNADRIRAMSDEELARHYAKRIAQCYGCEAVTEDDCFECQMEWLKAPVEGVQDGT